MLGGEHAFVAVSELAGRRGRNRSSDRKALGKIGASVSRGPRPGGCGGDLAKWAGLTLGDALRRHRLDPSRAPSTLPAGWSTLHHETSPPGCRVPCFWVRSIRCSSDGRLATSSSGPQQGPSRRTGLFRACVLVDGCVVGTWGLGRIDTDDHAARTAARDHTSIGCERTRPGVLRFLGIVGPNKGWLSVDGFAPLRVTLGSRLALRNEPVHSHMTWVSPPVKRQHAPHGRNRKGVSMHVTRDSHGDSCNGDRSARARGMRQLLEDAPRAAPRPRDPRRTVSLTPADLTADFSAMAQAEESRRQGQGPGRQSCCPTRRARRATSRTTGPTCSRHSRAAGLSSADFQGRQRAGPGATTMQNPS